MWTDNATKIDMLFYKPYADIVSETAISWDDEPKITKMKKPPLWKHYFVN